MITLSTIITLALANFGICYLVTKQDGPYGIFIRFSSWLLPKEIAQAKSETEVNSILKKTLRGNIYSIFDCPYCLGMWIAFLLPMPYLAQNISLDGLFNYIVCVMAVYGLHSLFTKVMLYENTI